MAAKSSPPYPFGDLLALARQSWVWQIADRLELHGYADYRRSDAAVLRLLSRTHPSISELGSMLGISRQAARKLADALERRGYARVETDQRDSRRLNVVLTGAGEAYAAAIVDVIHALNRELAARVDPEQLRAADAVLRASLEAGARVRADRLVRPVHGD